MRNFPFHIVLKAVGRALWVRVVVVVVGLCVPFLVAAQFGQSGGFGGGSGSFGGGFGSGSGSGGTQKLAIDSTEIFYFYSDNPTLVFPFGDSLLNEFQQYDPIRKRVHDYANLGNLGSPHRPIVYEPPFRTGFDLGFHQFDLYQKTMDDVPFYKIEQAYTNAAFSQGPTQQDLFFSVKFSRNFNQNLNFVIDHTRINNIGSYDHQKARHAASAFGFWYHAPGGRYDSFSAFIHNKIYNEDNGGGIEPVDTILPPFQVDVQLENAQTRALRNEFTFRQYFYLNRLRPKKQTAPRDTLLEALQDSVLAPKRDSLAAVFRDSIERPAADSIGQLPPPKGGPPPGQAPRPDFGKGFAPNIQAPPPPEPVFLEPGKRAFTIYHQLRYRTGKYKFFDDGVTDDSLYYGEKLLDFRGIRHFLTFNEIENTVKLQTFKLGEKDTSGLTRQKDRIEAGLLHRLNFVNQEPADTAAFQNLFLTGRIDFNPGERLRIRTYAHLGLLQNAGDFRLSGDLTFSLKKIGTIQAEVVNQLYAPTLIQHRFFNTQRLVWENHFNKTLESSLAGTYALPAFDFSVSVRNTLITNYIYFDTLARPRQENAVINLLQLTLQKDFRLGPVRFNNLLVFQNSSSSVLRVPDLYTKHSLYVEGKIFRKAMLARLGIDARLTTPYRADLYDPVSGQFHLQNQYELPFTPLVDVFFSFKVRTFRFFLKVENILTPVTRSYYYQVPTYALPFGWSNGGLRFGLSWRLVD